MFLFVNFIPYNLPRTTAYHAHLNRPDKTIQTIAIAASLSVDFGGIARHRQLNRLG